MSAIIQCKTPVKYKDPGRPTISANIRGTCVEKALLDLGAGVNLLPYSIYKQLGLGELNPTTITLSLVDRSVKIPKGIVDNVLVKVDKFYYPVDFIFSIPSQWLQEPIMCLSYSGDHSWLHQMQSSTVGIGSCNSPSTT